MAISLFAGKPAPKGLLVDVARLEREYYERSPDMDDRGQVGPILPVDGGDCEVVLAEFAKAGVDVNSLAAQRQEEGAKSFVKSWNEIMIDSKTADLAVAS